jgi:hypothetical protein
MSHQLAYYQDQIKEHKSKAVALKSKLTLMVVLRLVLFVAAGLALYFLHPNYAISTPVAMVLLVGFVFFIFKHNDLKRAKAFHEKLIEINENEIVIIEKDATHMAEGLEFKNPEHVFSNDIDLFGRGSFYQYMNRSGLHEGKQVLVDELTGNKVNDIELKQAIVQELSNKTKFRQEFSAHASNVECELPTGKVIEWLKEYKPVFKTIHFVIAIVFSICTLGILSATFLQLIPISIINLWIVIGLLFVGAYLKKINKTVFVVNKIGDSFSQYAELALLIESNEFEHPYLKEKIQVLLENGGASSLLRKFSKRLDAVNNRNNLLIGLFGNALFLYDYRSIYKMEKWIAANKDKAGEWFDAIHFLDGWNSLGAFAYNHDEFIYPTIVSDTNALIDSKKLAHPMIKKAVRVPSDFCLGGDDFTIVTGANMAGKSTFLRTIALSTMMSNMGLPVCAESFSYRPVKLISSMRTSDSLHEDESFFFSELKRLRFVVDHVEKEEYLILLDEILKGTNSVDKANGSAKFIEKLLKTSSAGIIATHDLSLCDLSDKYEQVKNKCFEAQIENDELTFDYKLKDGICQNMNASFLLKKMNLVD